MEEVYQAPQVAAGRGSETMLAPLEVQRMLALQALGWGSKRISRELGCSRNTVREYLRRGGWRPMDVSARASALEPHGAWLAERLQRHRGNADVVRQDLRRELGIEVSLRTVQRAVQPLRRELRAQALATVRYETAPGQQLQIDFGSTAVEIGGEGRRIHLFVATLGYSRRCYALVSWLQQRERTVYPAEAGYLAGPLAPPPEPIRPLALPLPETARGDSWGWATLQLGDLAEAGQWSIDFAGLTPLPPELDPTTAVPGIRLFGGNRALAIAGWVAGLEPVRLEVDGRQLVLEAALDDRWLLSDLSGEDAPQAAAALQAARQQAGGLQFLAVQASPSDQRFTGFWMLRDLPDS